MIDTHYVYRPKVLDPNRFREFAADVRSIIQNLPHDTVAFGPDGLGDPVVLDALVSVNGDRSQGQAVEPLIIEQIATRSRERAGRHFEYCKTNGEPYDLAVVAILYALKNRFPEIRFISDSDLDELSGGFELFRKAVQPAAITNQLRTAPITDREVVM